MDDEKPADPRGGINVSGLITALQEHATDAKKKMTSTQVSAAIALLKKVLPDLPAPVRKLAEDEEKLKTHEEALQELE